MIDKKIIILGAGGHGRVLLYLLRERGEEVFGFVDKLKFNDGSSVSECPILGPDEYLTDTFKSEFSLVNGIGTSYSLDLRKEIYLISYIMENVVILYTDI